VPSAGSAASASKKIAALSDRRIAHLPDDHLHVQSRDDLHQLGESWEIRIRAGIPLERPRNVELPSRFARSRHVTLLESIEKLPEISSGILHALLRFASCYEGGLSPRLQRTACFRKDFGREAARSHPFVSLRNMSDPAGSSSCVMVKHKMSLPVRF
jgi:hypothetical protein